MASGLSALTNSRLTVWRQTAQSQAITGKINKRIPRLSTADPAWFAVYIDTWPNQQFQQGDTARRFPLMSVINPVLLLYLLDQIGPEQVFQKVGTSPSDKPFNSLEQLKTDQGYPRNPMLNSGAIVLCDLLPGRDGPERCKRFLQWLHMRSGCRLQLDSAMLGSIWHAPPNLALMRYMAKAGYLTDGERALDTYERICSLAGGVGDLAQMGRLLALHNPVVKARHRHTVNALMLTCGLYEASATYAVRVGLPMQSGISGALLAIVPGQGAIATYGPALDAFGNSLGGLVLVEKLALALGLSVFC